MNNKVELIGYYGGDESHACSAWTSTTRNLTNEKKERIPAILKMLAEKGHHTPFEKSSLHFLVDSDIASHIHFLKHRIGVSINGESARYKELKEDKFYIPNDWKNVQSSSYFHINSDDTTNDTFENKDWATLLQEYTELSNRLYHSALKDLEPVIGRKRAKESARFFKTYNSQIQIDVMFNWRSFIHFQGLRNKLDAQLEIREIAEEMLNLVKQINGNPFQYSIEAFKL